jgi:hypothetical protein
VCVIVRMGGRAGMVMMGVIVCGMPAAAATALGRRVTCWLAVACLPVIACCHGTLPIPL